MVILIILEELLSRNNEKKEQDFMALINFDFRSETLKRSVVVNAILPIENHDGPFPTLYLLHGYPC